MRSRLAEMKCRKCSKRFSASLGGIESSPGIFFYFAIVCIAFCIPFYWCRNGFFGITCVFGGLAAILSLLVCLWECLMTNLGRLETKNPTPPYFNGRCQHCGNPHIVWPWSL
jgi:ribosomal protein S27E